MANNDKDKKAVPPSGTSLELQTGTVHDILDGDHKAEAPYALGIEYDAATERKLVRKIDWYLLLVVCCASHHVTFSHCLYVGCNSHTCSYVSPMPCSITTRLCWARLQSSDFGKILGS